MEFGQEQPVGIWCCYGNCSPLKMGGLHTAICMQYCVVCLVAYIIINIIIVSETCLVGLMYNIYDYELMCLQM